jgi:hypothetical protein
MRPGRPPNRPRKRQEICLIPRTSHWPSPPLQRTELTSLWLQSGAPRLFHGIIHLDRPAAHFAVFHIGLSVDRGVKHHRNPLTAVRAYEEKLHGLKDKVFGEFPAFVVSMSRPLRSPLGRLTPVDPSCRYKKTVLLSQSAGCRLQALVDRLLMAALRRIVRRPPLVRFTKQRAEAALYSCASIRASDTSPCRGLPASSPTLAIEDRGPGRRADLVRDRPSLRSSHRCRSGGWFHRAG